MVRSSIERTCTAGLGIIIGLSTVELEWILFTNLDAKLLKLKDKTMLRLDYKRTLPVCLRKHGRTRLAYTGWLECACHPFYYGQLNNRC